MIANIILLIPIIWGFIKGFKKGLIVELASILGIILGIYICAKFSDLLADYLGAKLHSSASSLYLSVIADVILFLGVLLLVLFIAKRIQKLAEALLMGPFNKILGGLFGAFKWALVISVVLYFFDILNTKLMFVNDETLHKSIVYSYLIKLPPFVMPILVKSKAKLLI